MRVKSRVLTVPPRPCVHDSGGRRHGGRRFDGEESVTEVSVGFRPRNLDHAECAVDRVQVRVEERPRVATKSKDSARREPQQSVDAKSVFLTLPKRRESY